MELHFISKSKEYHNKTPAQDMDSDKLPCPSVFLPIVENEYELERVRSEQLDNKAIALLTIIIALITVYVPILPLDKFVSFYCKSRTCMTIPIIFSVFVLVGIIAISISIYSAYKLIEVYKTKEYQAVGIEGFNSNKKMAYRQASRLQLELIDHYQAIILVNSGINSQKAEILGKQFRNIIIIFALLTISAIGTLIFIVL